MFSVDQFNTIITLARQGVKVFANNDQVPPDQIAAAAGTLTAFIAYAQEEVGKAQAAPKEATVEDPAPGT